MSFVVETGRGTPNANAYAPVSFVTTYLTSRGRETENSWSSKTTAEQQAACIAATDYIDLRWGRRLRGVRLREEIGGRQADGTILFGSNPGDTETVVVGQITYRFVNTLAQENDVLIAATAALSAANLLAAIHGSDDGTNVHEDTQPNYEVTASLSSATLTVTAQADGVNGNEIVFTTTVTGATISGSGTLTGGLDESPQPLEFPRSGAYDRYGYEIEGVPLKVRQAMAEYAVRAVAAQLTSDPDVGATGARVERTYQKVGPLEDLVVYAEGGAPVAFKPYPAADRLMRPFLTSAGVSR